MPDEYDVYIVAAETAAAAGDHASAEQHFLAALELAEGHGNELRLTYTLESLAETFWYQQKFSLAAPVLRRLLRKYENKLGHDHFDVAIVANNMAMLYHAWGKYADAEPFYKQALAIKQRILGRNHPETNMILGNYRDVLTLLNRHEEARRLDADAHSRNTSEWRRSKLSSESLPRIAINQKK
jgi:tetratricopeptide (TPR) repeat protein